MMTKNSTKYSFFFQKCCFVIIHSNRVGKNIFKNVNTFRDNGTMVVAIYTV